MSRLGYGALLRAGVAAGLRPSEVWAMTPAELQVVLGPMAPALPMPRARLDDLARRYPDKGKVENGGD